MWAPLHRVEELLAGSTRLDDSFFAVDDFMYMSWCRANRPQGLMIYQHRYTRAHINLDADGRAYRYRAPSADGPADNGSYQRYATLREAVDDLGLWELPWMRTDLDELRNGVSWDERFEAWARLTDAGLDRAS